jgi:hypothetical protein
MGATTLVDLHHSYAVPTISSGTSLTPPNAQLTGTGTSNGGLRKTYTVSFPSTSVLQTRQLLYGFWTRAGGGYTMRVDAQVVWIPSKPATAVVAPGAIEIQVRTIDSGTFVRVTKANVIDAITRTVNALRMRVPGAASCAAERSGTTLKVSFFHATRGQPYATAILQGSGCLIGTVTQYRPSGSVVTVGGLDAGGSAQHVAKLVGISLDT